MIRFVIGEPEVRLGRDGWRVLHPNNDAVLAYCDTLREANEVEAGLRALAVTLADPKTLGKTP